MEPIRSGTTTERIVRTSILTGLVVVFSGLYFKDGYYSYPRKNLEKLLENVPNPPAKDTIVINERVTRHAIQALYAMETAPSQEAIVNQFGEAQYSDGADHYYFGPGGMAVLTFRGGVLAAAEALPWRDGEKNEEELAVQKLIGAILGVLGFFMIVQMIRVLTTRIELTDAGLKVNSQGGWHFGSTPVVPIDAITGLGTETFRKKGWIEVQYKLSDGRSGSVWINDYVHKAFPEVVNEICRRRGFDDPVEQERAEKAAARAASNQEATQTTGSDEKA